MAISTPTTTIMHQDSSEGESGTTLPEQWKRSRIRRQVKKETEQKITELERFTKRHTPHIQPTVTYQHNQQLF